MQLQQLQVLFASDMEPHKQEQLKKGAALGRYTWHRILSCVLMLVGWRMATQCKYGLVRIPHGLFSTTVPQRKFDCLIIPTSALMLILELKASWSVIGALHANTCFAHVCKKLAHFAF